MNAFRRNYLKGYEIVLEEYKEERRRKGRSNVGYPNTFIWIYLSFLAIGASMALTVADMGKQEDPHVPFSLWVAIGWLVVMAGLILSDVI